MNFIKDFWREIMVFMFLAYAVVSLIVIARQRSEISDLKGDSPMASDESSDGPTAEVNEDTNNIDTSPVASSELSVDLPSGWILSDTTVASAVSDETQTYTNGAKTVDIIIYPSQGEVATDITWAFEYNKGLNNYNLLTTDTNEVFCVQGDTLCTYGDGRLQVAAYSATTPEGLTPVSFFFTDDEYDPEGDSFAALKEFIESVSL